MADYARYEEQVVLSMPKLSQPQQHRVEEALLPGGGSYPESMDVTFAAIHEGLTRNNTFYTKEGLTHSGKNAQGQPGGLESWLVPYGAPILKNHDHEVDPIGRVVGSRWVEREGKQRGHVEIKARITSPEAIEKFARGEYLTGSVGMDADSARCSICNLDFIESHTMCEHMRGRYYAKAPKGHEEEGQWIEVPAYTKGAKRAHVVIGNTWAREYSVVSVPSDGASQVKAIAPVSEMVLTDKAGNTFSLFEESQEAPIIQEASVENTEETQEQDVSTEIVPPVAETEEKVEVAEADTKLVETQQKTSDELLEAFAEATVDDPESLYFELCTTLSIWGDELEQAVGSVTLCKEEAERLKLALEDTHPELESEFAELAEAVLSTKSRNDLPDSAFALVKTVGGKKVRALPYKKADGSIDKSHLSNALSRWNQVKGFSGAEKARALRKLRAAAAKAGIGNHKRDGKESLTPEELEAMATTLRTAGYAVMKGEEHQERAEMLEELARLRRVAQEQDVEKDELLEMVQDLGNQVSENQIKMKRTLVERIVEYQEIEDSEREEKIAELLEKDESVLESQLDELAKQGRDRFITATMPKQSLALGEEKGLEESETPLSSEVVLTAMLSGPRSGARAELASHLERHRKS